MAAQLSESPPVVVLRVSPESGVAVRSSMLESPHAIFSGTSSADIPSVIACGAGAIFASDAAVRLDKGMEIRDLDDIELRADNGALLIGSGYFVDDLWRSFLVCLSALFDLASAIAALDFFTGMSATSSVSLCLAGVRRYILWTQTVHKGKQHNSTMATETAMTTITATLEPSPSGSWPPVSAASMTPDAEVSTVATPAAPTPDPVIGADAKTEALTTATFITIDRLVSSSEYTALNLCVTALASLLKNCTLFFTASACAVPTVCSNNVNLICHVPADSRRPGGATTLTECKDTTSSMLRSRDSRTAIRRAETPAGRTNIRASYSEDAPSVRAAYTGKDPEATGGCVGGGGGVGPSVCVVVGGAGAGASVVVVLSFGSTQGRCVPYLSP